MGRDGRTSKEGYQEASGDSIVGLHLIQHEGYFMGYPPSILSSRSSHQSPISWGTRYLPNMLPGI